MSWRRRAALAALLALGAPLAQAAAALRFNFTAEDRPGAVPVRWPAGQPAPRFDTTLGHGFVAATAAWPPRPVPLEGLRSEAGGAVARSAAADTRAGAEHANHFGLAFRIQVPPGAYDVRVRTTVGPGDATVSVSGLQASRLMSTATWDAAGLLPNRNRMTVQGHEWHYRHVSGRGFIDVEVEPRRPGVEVGLEAIELAALPPQPRAPGGPPTLFTLGDSTVKTYTFDEAPMSGWGQVIDRLFDPARLRLLNYSMGGRSYRSAYAEGRLDDLLLAGREGDVVMIQFGHNDESTDETRRWGRGATEAMVEGLVREVYLPAIRSRGMAAVLVAPMARVPGALKAGEAYVDSFQTRRFPALLRRLGAELGVPVVDLNARSVEYYNQAGAAAVTAMVMSIEAGETPGKSNTGSYANGHPADKIDGTHFKEALAKQYARLVVTELARLAAQREPTAATLVAALTPEVRTALASGDWAPVYPEIAPDIAAGEGAYYRNQIEKLLQLGVLAVDAQGRFQPEAPIEARDFAAALARLLGLPDLTFTEPPGPMTREQMAQLLLQAYRARFSAKPAYMTDYNALRPASGSATSDPNLDGGAVGARYDPLLPWERLRDTAAVSPARAEAVREAYALGLVRAEAGIARGRMLNGDRLEPQAVVSRAKAAKALYFMWVLGRPPKAENDGLDLGR